MMNPVGLNRLCSETIWAERGLTLTGQQYEREGVVAGREAN